MEFVPVGTTTDTMFQSLGGFQGKLYAGTYRRDWGPVAIYSYPPPFGPNDYMGRYDTGESIYKFLEFNNRFYAATESKGWIMRLNLAKTDWEIVYNGGRFNLILNIFRFKGYAYAYAIDYRQPDPDLYDGKIVRSSDGINWSDVWIAGDKFLPNFVEYENELYALGGHQNGKVWAKKTSDGTNWSDVSSLSGLFGGSWNCVVVGKGKMWVVRRVDHERKLYSYPALTEVFSLSNAPPRSEIIMLKDSFYLLLGPNGWSDPDNGLLYTSPSGEIGTWQLVKNFGNKSGRCMYGFEGNLYLGIQKTLYKMAIVEPDLTKLRKAIKIAEEIVKELKEKIQTVRERIQKVKDLLGKE